jgi:hypothetical protein
MARHRFDAPEGIRAIEISFALPFYPVVTAARSPTSMGDRTLMFRGGTMPKEKGAQDQDSPFWARQIGLKTSPKTQLFSRSIRPCKRRASSATIMTEIFDRQSSHILLPEKCKWNLQGTVVIFGKYLEVSANSFMILVTCREHCVYDMHLQKV